MLFLYIVCMSHGLLKGLVLFIQETPPLVAHLRRHEDSMAAEGRHPSEATGGPKLPGAEAAPISHAVFPLGVLLSYLILS
jgi:hypothetical protein